MQMTVHFFNVKRPGFLRSIWSVIHQRIIEPFVLSQTPPWFDARGAALGLLVGMGFPLGIQWVSLGLLRLVFRFNMVLALALTWVNNPFTVAPMYYGYYLLGSTLIGSPADVTLETFTLLTAPVFEAENFSDSLSGLAETGVDILLRWAIGATVVGLSSGALGYIVTYYVQVHRHRKRSLPRSP